MYTLDGEYPSIGPPVVCRRPQCRRSSNSSSKCFLCDRIDMERYGMVYPAEVAAWYTTFEMLPGICCFETTSEYKTLFDYTARLNVNPEKLKLASRILSFSRSKQYRGRVLRLGVTLSLSVVSVVLAGSSETFIALSRLLHVLYAFVFNRALAHLFIDEWRCTLRLRMSLTTSSRLPFI